MLNIKKFGECIAKARSKKCLSQKKLAELLYVSPQAISNWERGISFPEMSKLDDIVTILNIDANELAPFMQFANSLNSNISSNFSNETPPYNVSSVNFDEAKVIIKLLMLEASSKGYCAQSITSLFRECLDNNDFEYAAKIAPFVSCSIVDDEVESVIKNTDLEPKWELLLSFTSYESRNMFLSYLYNKYGVDGIVKIIPFSDESMFNGIKDKNE